MNQKELLDKYYSGKTTLEEEQMLKIHFQNTKNHSAEKDMFGFFQKENEVPAGLEVSVFARLTEHQNMAKSRKIRFYSIISTAAVIIVTLSIYLNFQAKEKVRIENNFFVMEQALFQVSESIQPEEQQEMLVLWVDNDVEIIIN